MLIYITAWFTEHHLSYFWAKCSIHNLLLLLVILMFYGHHKLQMNLYNYINVVESPSLSSLPCNISPDYTDYIDSYIIWGEHLWSYISLLIEQCKQWATWNERQMRNLTKGQQEAEYCHKPIDHNFINQLGKMEYWCTNWIKVALKISIKIKDVPVTCDNA